MKRDLLLHSMMSFSPITLPILEAVKPAVIAEIGAEHGGHSKLLYDWLKPRNGKLISIDCNPSQVFIDWLASAKDVVQHVPKESLNVLPEIQDVDVWFVDGDHNWYTVYHELKLIRELNKKQNRNTLIFLHDVGWPWARRDLYYSPDRIPENFRHSFTWDGGVTLDNNSVIEGGFRGLGAYAIARQEGGQRNGVLTAVDDFTKEFPGEYCYAHVPAVFGLGVLFNPEHPQAAEIASVVAPFHHNKLLEMLELNRLDNYLKVIELQDQNQSKLHKPAMQNRNENVLPTPAMQNPHILPMPSMNDNASDPANLLVWESQVVSLLNMLNDGTGQSDIWNRLNANLPHDQNQLKQLINYLKMLTAVPQEPNTIKLIGVLQAMCHAKFGNLKLAHKCLEELYAANPNCPLLLDAYTQTFTFTNETA